MGIVGPVDSITNRRKLRQLFVASGWVCFRLLGCSSGETEFIHESTPTNWVLPKKVKRTPSGLTRLDAWGKVVAVPFLHHPENQIRATIIMRYRL